MSFSCLNSSTASHVTEDKTWIPDCSLQSFAKLLESLLTWGNVPFPRCRSDMMTFFGFLKHAKLTQVSETLHLLFPLPGTTSPQISTPLTPSHHPSLSSNTFRETSPSFWLIIISQLRIHSQSFSSPWLCLIFFLALTLIRNCVYVFVFWLSPGDSVREKFFFFFFFF